MRLYPTILLVSTIICPAVAEVLTQSFVIRLKEMDELIQYQKNVIDALKSGRYNDKNTGTSQSEIEYK